MSKGVSTGLLAVLGLSIVTSLASAQTPGQPSPGQPPQDRRQARVERRQAELDRMRQRVEARLQARMDRLDRNHDGGVSRDEWTGAPRRFDRLDSNHDGVLTKDELVNGSVWRRLMARRRARRGSQ
jgi:hypothetical protein